MTTTIGSLLDIMACHMLETDRTFNSGLWTQEEVIYALALADQDFLQTSGLVKKSASVAGTANTIQYSEPSDSEGMERISYNGKKMYPQTAFELDRQDPRWRAARARNVRRFHQDNLPEYTFEVWPGPTADGTGWTVTGRYGTARTLSGRTYSVTGRYGIIRKISGDTSYFVGSWFTPSTQPYLGTIRQAQSGTTNFTLIHDVLGTLQTLVTDYMLTPDAFVRYAMYSALARLWSKEGDSQDLSRAQYCVQRYNHGAWLARRLIYGDGQPALKQ